MRLLHKGESLCCFRDSASVTYGGMLPSDLTLSALRFILSAKSRQSCKQDCETVDFCNSLLHGRNREVEGIGKFIRRYSGLSSEETKNSSELSFHSSEVPFHSSEVLFRPSVESFCFLVSYWAVPRELSDLAKMYEYR